MHVDLRVAMIIFTQAERQGANEARARVVRVERP